jgi:two-component system response regulator YesN
MNIVLIDDEIGIVEGLKTIVKRYIPECRVVGTAYNGLEGIKLVQEKKPDIVITDIRMAQADGLEMIQMLKAEGCGAKFIILSGYAEFEYARKGMQLGVQFYINKPVEEEEVRDCVIKLMAEIRQEKARLQEMDDLRYQADSRMTESILREVIDAGSENMAYLNVLKSTLPSPVSHSRYLCALIEIDAEPAMVQEKQLQCIYEMIDSVLGACKGMYRFRYAESRVVIICSHDKSRDEPHLARAVKSLQKILESGLGLKMSAGIGTVHKGFAGIGKSFEEAEQALNYKVLKGIGSVLSYTETVNLKGNRVVVSEEQITRLEACIKNEDEDGSVAVIHDIFDSLSTESCLSLSDLQFQCLNILLSSIRKLSFYQLQHNDFLGKHILSLEGISRFKTMEQLRDWMTDIIKRVIEFQSVRNMPRKKDVITEIRDYLTEHYHENISLAELSGRFFINPYYLSQLFKQKTGDTYLNYLIHIRMNSAKELLEKTDLKVYEISQKVGYSDSNHFAKLFERLVGCKPTEYRKKCAGE